MAENLIVGLDIGSTATRVAVGELNENNVLEIIGVGTSPSTGVRRGVVVNIEATMTSIGRAVESAELMSGREIKEVICGVAGANVEGINSRGVVAVTGKGKEITHEDVARVLEAARAVSIPVDREVLHVIPQTYIVDEQRGVREPVDMIGVRLEAEVHIITASVTTAQNLVRCINRAGFKVERLVLQGLAAAAATLSGDEKDLGCLLVDLGGGTTDILVFADGAPYFSSMIPVGGIQLTNDLSIMLSLPMETAEKIKREIVCVYRASVDPEEMVVLPGLGSRGPSEIARRSLTDIAQPRMEELFGIVRERVEKVGHWNHIKGGAVLTGGGSLTQGVVELAQEVFGMPVRIGNPITVGGLVEEYRNPILATAVGLVMVGAENLVKVSEKSREREVDRSISSAKKDSIGARFVDWIKKGFF